MTGEQPSIPEEDGQADARHEKARALWDHFGRLLMELAKSYQESQGDAADRNQQGKR